MGFIATSCFKRRNRCHYQTLKNVSSHSWIKADGSNSQRVPNHPPQTPVCTPTYPPNYPGVNNICSICPMDKKANPSHWWTPLGAHFVNNVFQWSSSSLFLMIKKFRQKLMLHLHEINTSVFPSEIQLEMPALQILSKSWGRDRWLLRKLCRSTGLPGNF